MLRALSLPPPPKRRTATAALTSALRRNAAAARAALRATVLGDGRRKHAERAKDGLRLGVAMAGAATIMLALPRGAHGVWAPVTVAFVWEPGLGASLRNSGLRLQGSVLGVFAGYLAVSAARRVQAGAARDAALLLLFGLWVSICGFVKASMLKEGSNHDRQIRAECGAEVRAPCWRSLRPPRLRGLRRRLHRLGRAHGH